MRLKMSEPKSLLDTTLADIILQHPRLANMTPRQIACELLFMKCRLRIAPGHPCRQQLPFVTFKSVKFEMGSVFILDSCIWYGEQWVIRMDLNCALILCVSPVRVIQGSLGQNDAPICAVAPTQEVCSCMDIMRASDYLELLRKHTALEHSYMT